MYLNTVYEVSKDDATVHDGLTDQKCEEFSDIKNLLNDITVSPESSQNL